MDLQQIIRESYSQEDDTFIGAVILPEVLTTPARQVFNPNDVMGIQVWNRGLCNINERYAFGNWYVFMVQEHGLDIYHHVMAYNTASGQWLHVAANFDYQPVGVVVKRKLEKNWPPNWAVPFLKSISRN